MRALIVDGANVVGSRPDSWWRDRAGAAGQLWERVAAADLPHDEVVVVLEGAAEEGVPAGGTVASHGSRTGLRRRRDRRGGQDARR